MNDSRKISMGAGSLKMWVCLIAALISVTAVAQREAPEVQEIDIGEEAVAKPLTPVPPSVQSLPPRNSQGASATASEMPLIERDVAAAAPMRLNAGRAKDETELQVQPVIYVPSKTHSWERKPLDLETTSED